MGAIMIPKNSQFNDFDRFRADDNFCWQPSGARQIAKGNSQGERGGVHQFGALVCKAQPCHRTSEINCAFRMQKLRISEQTKGFSRLRSAETAWNHEFV